MTRFRRVWNIISGVFIMALGLLLLIEPVGGLPVVAMILSVGLTLSGLRALGYYFSMARFMVGGKRILYRGMFFLDLGVLTSSLNGVSSGYIILYVAALHIFYGAVDILNGIEAKKLGSPSWKYRVVYGSANVLIAMAILVGGIAFNSISLAVYFYAAGLIYTAVIRILSAFRKTAIVYIQ